MHDYLQTRYLVIENNYLKILLFLLALLIPSLELTQVRELIEI
jgi:hypothetical protein